MQLQLGGPWSQATAAAMESILRYACCRFQPLRRAASDDILLGSDQDDVELAGSTGSLSVGVDERHPSLSPRASREQARDHASL